MAERSLEELKEGLARVESAIVNKPTPVPQPTTPAYKKSGQAQSVPLESDDSVPVTIKGGSSAGTEYTEDAAAAANPAGGVTILVRADTPAGVTSTDGDNVAQRGTDYGAAYVQVVDSSGNFVDSFGGSGGTSAADDADFTAGTTLGTPIQGVYESSPTSVTDGDLGTVGITATRELKVSDATAQASLSVLDDWDETNRAAVNLIASQAGITGGAGAVAANTPRVTLASDDPAVAALQTLDNAISGNEMQVDVVAPLPAGTNAIGKLAANSGVDIGSISAATTGGASMHFDADGDNTAQQVKASAGSLYALEVSNPNSADAYLQLFDVDNGSITVGTTTPNLSLLIPAGDGTLDGARDMVFTVPVAFGTAINYACTTTATGNGDPSTGLVVNVIYK